MSGHIHTDFYTLFWTTLGVFLAAHVFRVLSASASQIPALHGPATSVGAFFTLS